MLLFKQLELAFHPPPAPARGCSPVAARARRPPNQSTAGAVALQLSAGRDFLLATQAREILCALGARRLAEAVSVEWNARLRSAAGRADYRRKLVSLNPRLREHDPSEIDRTFRHELAHLLAQFRAGRRRILPHGPEWRLACRDLGIANETRCHTLPFPTRSLTRGLLYKCPNCRRDFPRVRRILRSVACLACCRVYNRGQFDQRFRLKLIRSAAA
jgi:predicted SprT family Zn-dependent metalloprotease